MTVPGSEVAVLAALDATAWSGLLVIAAGVLALAGAAKVASPAAATAALDGIGIPVPAGAVRVLGVVEVVVGAWTLLVGGVAAVAVAVAYLGFAVVAAVMSRSSSVRSCGCFGDGGARPGPAHIAVNLLSVVACAGAAATGSGAVIALVDDTPWAGVPALASAALGIAAIIVLLTIASEARSMIHSDVRPEQFHLVEPPR